MKTFFKIPKLSAILIILIAVLASQDIKATDYYVASNGNNGNAGTIGSPWLTMGHVASRANAGLISAGDHIYFRRGDVFSGHMQITNNGVWGGSANSGTSSNPIVIGAYGTGARPVMQFLTSDPGYGTYGRDIILLIGVDYWTIQDINFTDLQGTTTNDKWSIANNSCAIHLGFDGDGVSNHCLIQNDTITLCGLGVVIVGDQNTVTNCHMGNFRDLVNTNDGGNGDYGANGVTVTGSDNVITHNTITSAWAESYDFGFNGGAIELSKNCDRNIIMYNYIYDCGGLAEFGGKDHTVTCDDNLFAYNKITNCGAMIYCNIGGAFAEQVANTKFYNNVVVEDNSSRFSGTAHFGDSLTHSAAIAHLTKDTALFLYDTVPVATYLNIVKNNVFQLSSGIDVFKPSDSHLSHTNNVFKLSGTSNEVATADPSESSTSATIFTNTTAPNPINWDFYPVSGSPQIGGGTNVSLTPDFDGYTVAATPTVGPLEYRGLTSITTGTISPAGYCAGGSVSVPFTVIGAANAGNIFTAQISNSSGSFSSPATVGTLSSTTAGTISGTIPSGTTAGTGYYIRVISSNPSFTGSSYGPITVSTATPSQPSLINGPLNACMYFSSPATYSINPVTNATSYIWTLPTGATGSSTTTSINVIFDASFVSGTSIGVQAVSYCGTSTMRTLNLSRLNPGSPTGITGAADVCPYLSGTPTVTYSTSSTNSQSYAWVLPTGASGSSTTSSIVVTYSGSFSPGNLTVQGVNGCTSSAARALAIFKIPKQPSVITGNATPCAPSSGEMYSVTDLGYTYTWTAPTNASVTAGQNTATATLSFTGSFVSGNVTVTATNACGTSTARTFAVAKCGPRSISTGIPTSIAQIVPTNTLYPNPSNGDFTIAIVVKEVFSAVKIEIINQMGEVVYRSNEKSSNGNITMHLAGTLANGVYGINYTIHGKKFVQKLVINK